MHSLDKFGSFGKLFLRNTGDDLTRVQILFVSKLQTISLGEFEKDCENAFQVHTKDYSKPDQEWYAGPDTDIRVVPEDDHFVKTDNGVIHDTKTDLEWYVGPDTDMTWIEAKEWVNNLSLDGGGWDAYWY